MDQNEFLEVLKKFDKEIEKEPYIKDVIIQVLEQHYSIDYPDYILLDNLSDYFDAPYDSLIFEMVTNNDIPDLLKSEKKNFKYGLFYIHISEKYVTESNRQLLRSVSPLYLSKIIPIKTNNLDLGPDTYIRFLRADKQYMDFYLNTSTYVFIMESLLSVLETSGSIEGLNDDFLNGRLRSYIQKILKLFFSDELNISESNEAHYVDGDTNEH